VHCYCTIDFAAITHFHGLDLLIRTGPSAFGGKH